MAKDKSLAPSLGRTINGALPPNSSDTRFTVDAHMSSIFLPTSVLPVNETFITRGSEHNILPILIEFCFDAVSKFKTPSGNTVSASLNKAIADSGVSGAGFAIIVQPAANAGAIFRVNIASGKFHGVINAEIPTGLYVTSSR